MGDGIGSCVEQGVSSEMKIEEDEIGWDGMRWEFVKKGSILK